MKSEKIQSLEKQIYDLTLELNKLREDQPPKEISDYTFKTLEGTVQLSEMFAGKDKLLVIHNMGQGCRYCTLWADGINPFVSHLETAMSVVLVSKDSPELQRTFANSRNWRFRTASHEGGAYIQEQSVSEGQGNYPGAVVYEKSDSGKILRTNSVSFGPYDQFCSIWNFLSLAKLNEGNWTPQYNYWKRPEKLDDGGQNLN